MIARKLILPLALFCIVVPAARAWADSGDFGTAAMQFRQYNFTPNAILNSSNEAAPDPSRALQYAHALSGGAWPDIDYKSRMPSAWPPMNHCTRLVAMAVVAFAPQTKPTDRELLVPAIHAALEHWMQRDLKCGNWWYNNIGIPSRLGTLALLMGDELRPGEFSYITGTVLPRSKIGMTGQNRVWLAGNTLMLALLTRNESLARTASATLWEEVRITDHEGLQADFSYHQHGPQQQFGNYGMSFATDEAKWAQVLRGTSWAMPPEKMAVFRDYLLRGENWVTWRGVMDISCCGRQLEPDSPTAKATIVAGVMRTAAVMDPPHASDYLAFVHRNAPGAPNDLVGCNYFWKSDYLVARRPDSCITVKMASRRTIGTESINGENLSGYHLPDGATYLYRSGDEYRNIEPVWDWCKLPGITAPQRSDGPPKLNSKDDRVSTTFVGGAVDGDNAVAALDYDRDGLQAHKAWFIDKGTLFCLGADIHCTTDAAIATTLNQCLLRGPVQLGQQGKTSSFNGGDSTLADVDWVEHDGWRYAFPQPTRIHLRTSSVTGRWSRVYDNPSTPTGDVTQNVFCLWLDQGVESGSQYAYAVLPAGQNLTAKPLANSAALQAVAFDNGRVGFVFWTAGEITLRGSRLKADHSCVVLLDLTERRAVVADPTESLKELTLTYGGNSYNVVLPTGGQAGASTPIDLK